MLVQKSRVSIWLYDNTDLRLEGRIMVSLLFDQRAMLVAAPVFGPYSYIHSSGIRRVHERCVG